MTTQTRTRRGRGGRRLTVLAAVGAVTAATVLPATGADHGVTPQTVEATLAPGGELVVEKSVTAPTSTPKADVYFLADTTGSMFAAISAVQSSFDTITSTLTGAGEDIEFGAGDYKDFPFDPYAFQNPTPAGSPLADVEATVAAWTASGGADGSEGQFFALQQLADGAAGFRDDAARIIVWFGDAPGHDPICSEISGAAADITEATVTDALVAEDITVIAVNTNGGFPDALDDDPTASAGNYSGTCDTIGGTAGQATRIAAATGGLVVDSGSDAAIADAILGALEALPVTIAPVASCDEGLSVSFDADEVTVAAGGTADFVETIAVADDAAPGELSCTVDFTLNGATGVDGFVQSVTVTVEDPVTCVDLVAAGGNDEGAVDVGDVCIAENADGTVTVTYTTVDGWVLDETHLHVSCDGLDGVPTTRKGNPQVGRFDSSGSHDGLTEVVYEVEGCEGDPLVAAHAEVSVGDDEVRTESAWADGSDFPGRNWATYVDLGES